MITTTICFDHRGRTKKGADGPVEVRVTINRKSYYINTGVRVRASEFRAGIIVNRPDSAELNERLIILSNRAEAEINRCLADGVAVDVAQIRRSLTAAQQPTADFLEWVADTIPDLNVTNGTRAHYNTLCRRLQEWGGMVAWRDVDAEHVMSFDAWLRNSCHIGDAGVYNHHKCLKSLLTRADAMELISRNPYSRLRGRIKRGEHENTEYLTDGEMEAIQALKLECGSVLDRARDLFVFQMYTGMAYADAMSFCADDYTRDGDGMTSNQSRVKTGVAFIGRLLPPAAAVVEKYGGDVPRMDAADYNHALKVIGAAAGIKIRMHSHLARHTFATFMLRHGVKIENLQRMLGHNSIVTTQRYAKVLAQSVRDDYAAVEAEMKKRR